MKLQNTDAFILLSFAHDIRNVTSSDIPMGYNHLVDLNKIASRYVKRLINAGHSSADAYALLNDVIRQVRSEKEAA